MNLPTGLTDRERSALRELKTVLDQDFGPVSVSLFGSKVTGQASPESDIDVMIEIPERDQEIEAKIDDAIFAINLRYDVLISAVLFGKDELREGPLAESPLYRSVTKDGILL